MTGNQAIIANFFPLLIRQLLVLALLVSTAYPSISFAQQNPLQRLMQQQQLSAPSPSQQNYEIPSGENAFAAGGYDQDTAPRVASPSPLSQAMQRVILSNPHSATENKVVPVSLGVPASKSQIAYDNQFRYVNASRQLELPPAQNNQKYPNYNDAISVSIKPLEQKAPVTAQNAEYYAQPATPLSNLIEISSIRPAEAPSKPVAAPTVSSPLNAVMIMPEAAPAPNVSHDKMPSITPHKIESVAAEPISGGGESK